MWAAHFRKGPFTLTALHSPRITGRADPFCKQVSEQSRPLVPETPAPGSRQKRKAKARKIRATFHLPMELFELGARRGLLDTRPYSLQPVRSRSAIRNRKLGAEAGRSLPKAGGRSQGRPPRQDLPMTAKKSAHNHCGPPWERLSGKMNPPSIGTSPSWTNWISFHIWNIINELGR